jgi:hypothetical protein
MYDRQMVVARMTKNQRHDTLTDDDGFPSAALGNPFTYDVISNEVRVTDRHAAQNTTH